MISLRRYTNENQQNLSAQVPTRVSVSTKSATFHDNLCIYAPPPRQEYTYPLEQISWKPHFPFLKILNSHKFVNPLP